MLKKFLAVISFIFVIFGVAASANAGSPILYFKVSDEPVAVGDEFSVEVLIDSSQPLNAYVFSVKFPADIFQVLSFNNANSIIDVKRSEPEVFEDGSIKFAGASLKPFLGKGGLVSVINFKAIKAGVASLNFTNAKVYVADGKGTKMVPELKPLDVKIEVQNELTPRKIEFTDTNPPSLVFLNLTHDPITPGRKLLSFLAKDDVSGVKEVLYREKRWFWWSDFHVAQNPTALPLDVWAVQLRVVDNAGNVAEQSIYDWSAIVEPYLIFWVVIVLVAIVVINRFIRRRGYNNRSNG